MNKKRMEKVAAFLEELPRERFDQDYVARGPLRGWETIVPNNMRELGEDCGTAGCIAGWTCVVAKIHCEPYEALDSAKVWLGLDDTTAEWLFRSAGHGLSLSWCDGKTNPTPKQAAKAIRSLLV